MLRDMSRAMELRGEWFSLEAIEAFEANYVAGVAGECWEWRGRRTGKYGRFHVNSQQYWAHRVAYVLWVGPIEEGMTVDHVAERGCRGGLCVNPGHLEKVTVGENTRRYQRTLPAVVQCSVEGHAPRQRGEGPCRKCRVLAVARSQAKKPEKYREMKREAKRRERLRKRGEEC